VKLGAVAVPPRPLDAWCAQPATRSKDAVKTNDFAMGFSIELKSLTDSKERKWGVHSIYIPLLGENQ
jgi:hypothetical protein